MDADLFEVLAVSRNDDGDSIGDLGALDGAEEGCLDGSRVNTRLKPTSSHYIDTVCPPSFHVQSSN
jgi:hypothetical protein